MSGFRTAAVGSLKTTSRPMRYRSSSSALAATALRSYTPLMAPTSSAVGSALLYQTSPLSSLRSSMRALSSVLLAISKK